MAFASKIGSGSTKTSSPVVQSQTDNEQMLESSGNESSLQKMHAGIQAKLSMGEPGDKFEQDADNTAARVMSKPESNVQLQAAEPEEIQQMTEEESAVSTKSLLQPALFDSEKDVSNDMLNAKEEDAVQAKESKQNPGADFENKLNSSKAGGEKLPADTQTEMENRFGGKDFSNVRVHTDSASTEMNKDVKSKAFTNENHIFFNSGQFSNSDSGKELLAHELTHTIQQGATDDKVQAKPEDYMKQEDEQSSRENTEESFADELGEDVSIDSTPVIEEDSDEKPAEDEKDKEKGEEVAAESKPDADRFEETKPSIDNSKKEIDTKAKEESKENGMAPQEAPKPEKKKLSKKEIAALEAAAAFGRSEKVKHPKRPKEVKMPELQIPVNAEGEEVSSDRSLLMQLQLYALMIAQVRERGYQLQISATEKKKEAEKIKGTIHLVRQSLFENEEGLQLQYGTLDERKVLMDQGKEQQKISEEKVTKVEGQIPGVLESSKQLHEESQPMVADVKEQKKEREEAATTEDPDASENASEAAGELNSSEQDTTSLDTQFGGMKNDAQEIFDAQAPSKEANQLSAKDLAESDQMLVQTEEKTREAEAHNLLITAHTEAILPVPDEMILEANQLDKLGAKKVKESLKMEKQLHTMQKNHLSRMSSVKGDEFAPSNNPDKNTVQQKQESTSFIQRQPNDNVAVNADNVADIDAQLRQDEENLEGYIMSASDDLNGGERTIKGLTDTGEAIWEDISGIDWYQLGEQFKDGMNMLMNNPGEFFATMFTSVGEGILSFFAPREMLPGESYTRYFVDRMASMVTGLATVFGLIAGLCALAIGIIGFISFWFFPSAVPMWPELPGLTIAMKTFGGYALLLAEIALALRGVIAINDIIGMAMAGTAEEQRNWTRMMKQNVSGIWAPLMIWLPTKFLPKNPKLGGNKKGVGSNKSGTGNKNKTGVSDEGAVVRNEPEINTTNEPVRQDLPENTGTQNTNTTTRNTNIRQSQVSRFWTTSKTFEGIKVFTRNDIFDPNRISSWKVKGKVVTGTNVERMASGRAPVGIDGKPVNLHHMIQSDAGSIAEMTQTFHKTNHGIIHINPNTIPSGINRAAFDSWRGRYWQNRALDFQ